MTAGRPTLYSPELAEAIYNRILDGVSLPKLCAEEGMPSRQTLWQWMQDKKDFLTLITQARRARAAYYVDEIVDIADESTPEDWQVKRLKIEAIKNYAKMVDPVAYGDRVEHTGAGGKPLIPDNSDVNQLSKILAYFFSAGLAAREQQGAVDGETVEQVEQRTIEAGDHLPDA